MEEDRDRLKSGEKIGKNVSEGEETGPGARLLAPTVMGWSAESRMSSITSLAKARRARSESRFLSPVRLTRWILSQSKP